MRIGTHDKLSSVCRVCSIGAGVCPILENHSAGCHGNHAFLHSPNQFNFKDTFVLHLRGPKEQFGTHEKLLFLCKVSQIGCSGKEIQISTCIYIYSFLCKNTLLCNLFSTRRRFVTLQSRSSVTQSIYEVLMMVSNFWIIMI